MKCRTCQDTRHILAEDGRFRRCPECFATEAVGRLLTQHGYPAEWAGVTVDRLADVVGHTNPLVQAIRGFLTGESRALHLVSAPSEARQATFAVVLRGLLARYRRIGVYDTADLAIEYFKKEGRREFHVERAPIILTLGREMEKKVGAFYFRYLVGKAAAWHMPIALFTDHHVDGMTRDYFGFRDDYALGGFRSYVVTG